MLSALRTGLMVSIFALSLCVPVNASVTDRRVLFYYCAAVQLPGLRSHIRPKCLQIAVLSLFNAVDAVCADESDVPVKGKAKRGSKAAAAAPRKAKPARAVTGLSMTSASDAPLCISALELSSDGSTLAVAVSGSTSLLQLFDLKRLKVRCPSCQPLPLCDLPAVLEHTGNGFVASVFDFYGTLVLVSFACLVSPLCRPRW
jgi:hypothetical protein